MPKTLSKILLILFLSLSIFGCKNGYKVKDYLSDLATITGFNEETYLDDLRSYGIIDNLDMNNLNQSLSKDFVLETSERFFLEREEYERFLKEDLIVDLNKKSSVNQAEAITIIELLAKHINNIVFKEENNLLENKVTHLDNYSLNKDVLFTEDSLQKDELVYLIQDEKYARVDEVLLTGYKLSYDGDFFKEIDLSANEKELDFSKVEIVEYEGNTSAYTNNNYLMLSSEKENFLKDFELSYVTSKNGLDIRLQRNKDDKKVCLDFTLSNIKTTYKIANDKDSDQKSSYFKVNFNVSQKASVSSGKYKYYYLDYRDLEADDFFLSVNKAVHTKNDALEASIPICTLKLPIGEIPTLYLNVDVLLNAYVSGKVELLIENKGYVGFECRNKTVRLIKDIENKADLILGANTKAAASLNFNLTLANMRLCDAQVSLGIKGSVSTILHLYDENNQKESVNSDIEYYALDDIAKENNNVFVCGDVSLNWVLDVTFNTSKTKLYKFGLNRKFEILNKEDQVFGNKTHIENFHFVETCTRKKKANFQNNSLNLDSDKIVLNTYSFVIIKDKEATINIKGLPSGYTQSDVVLKSEDESVATISGFKVKAIKLGSTRIVVSTKDDKYKSYINILVSTG